MAEPDAGLGFIFMSTVKVLAIQGIASILEKINGRMTIRHTIICCLKCVNILEIRFKLRRTTQVWASRGLITW